MEKKTSPYVCHLFICVNDRGGQKKACADGRSPELKARLKEGVEKRGWKGRVRVSHSGCMGLCAQGPNVMIYPHGLWFSGAAPDDTDRILDEVARRLGA